MEWLHRIFNRIEYLQNNSMLMQPSQREFMAHLTLFQEEKTN